MNHLDPFKLPLNQSSLIEASAGTGKTYTMANLYLRLVLGVGCEPLNVEQILVVTFTKAATQELRSRIREKLVQVGKWFRDPTTEDAQKALVDPFLAQIYQTVKPNLNQALLRLKIAEREIDLASIFTIDSFCQKMLFQFAFDSGIRFDLDLLADEDELLTRLSEETWRELFYPMGLLETQIVAQELRDPKGMKDSLKSYLYKENVRLSEEQHWVTEDFSHFLAEYQPFLQAVKYHWQTIAEDANVLILNEMDMGKLNGTTYTEKNIHHSFCELNKWAGSESLYFPSKSFNYFCQNYLILKTKKAFEPLHHPIFVKNQSYLTDYQEKFERKQALVKSMLYYQFLAHLRQKINVYKQTHKEKSFNDMVHFLLEALRSERGESLAQQIRNLYPFAMIDEFQDTNQAQYEIFSRIFMPEGVKGQGFIMIGDPKQSIYKFRGADIFTYLKASRGVSQKATLTKNWRSAPAVVESCNNLFRFSGDLHYPFLYQEIEFQAVEAHSEQKALVGESATQCFLLEEPFDEKRMAEHCAYQIQQQLKRSEQKQLFLQKGDEIQPLAANDIAILVRSHKQASLIRSALFKRNIPSVFFSERNSVYTTQEAKDLGVVLQACLNPYRQSMLLAALATSLWGLSSDEVFQLKQNETVWDSCVEKFVNYHQTWLYQGILPMLHQIFIKENIIQKINASANAERRITDLLHLAELLQGAMPNLENESALLRWYQQQLENPNEHAEEQIQRLESEEHLIKVVTIHGSKGLEYPIVWLPFVAKASTKVKSQTMATYQDEKGDSYWSFGSQSGEIKAQIDRAEFAEDLRLLYVAVTRAKYQLNLMLPSQFEQHWNSLSYLLSNGEIGLGGIKPSQSCESYLIQKGMQESIRYLPKNVVEDSWQPEKRVSPEISANTFEGKIRYLEQITSFSSLQALNERLQKKGKITPLAFGDDTQDYDLVGYQNALVEDNEGILTPYLFPHSTRVGNVLHKFFELWDFTRPLDVEALRSLCEQLNLDETWIAPLQKWFKQIISTKFGEQAICLNQISATKCLNEWQFYLRLANEKALPQLNLLLRQHTSLAKNLPELTLYQLEGFVRGFVDCFAQVGDKFYIIDYKSNYLGNLPQDYSQEKLQKAVGQFRYDLQYLLYTLAAHRYLRSRLGENYDYQRDFGGVAYLFLRGMDGEDHNGVYFDKPSRELIVEMDRLFG